MRGQPAQAALDICRARGGNAACPLSARNVSSCLPEACCHSASRSPRNTGWAGRRAISACCSATPYVLVFACGALMFAVRDARMQRALFALAVLGWLATAAFGVVHTGIERGVDRLFRRLRRRHRAGEGPRRAAQTGDGGAGGVVQRRRRKFPRALDGDVERSDGAGLDRAGAERAEAAWLSRRHRRTRGRCRAIRRRRSRACCASTMRGNTARNASMPGRSPC